MTTLQMTSQLERAINLHAAGFAVIPIGKGAEGKEPLTRWNGARLPRGVIARLMAKHNSRMYGVRLDEMVVLDVDTNDKAVVAELEAHFGPASVLVETPRGFHLYYGQGYVPPARLKREGLSVDVKWGPGHYVAGPGSVRPCGGMYTEVRGKLGETPLKPISPASIPARTKRGAPASAMAPPAGKISVGHRHVHVKRRAIELVRQCETPDELFENLIFVRDEECDLRETISDDEVLGIARWTWEKCESGELAFDTGGVFHVPRHFMSRLGGNPEAIALYAVLREKHGHRPGTMFSLSHKGMREAGLLNFSERAFHNAKRLLMKVGAVEVAVGHRVGKRCRQYRLGRIPQG